MLVVMTVSSDRFESTIARHGARTIRLTS
jgi:hypothetical protein